MKKTIRSIAIATALALMCASPAFAKEKEEDENLKASDVPAAVQKAADSEAKGGKIVRWEKENGNYEAVIDKGGKQWGVQIDANGKVLSKHDESKEKGEKHEKH
jgi:plastocyanin